MNRDEYEKIIASPEFRRFEEKVDTVIWFVAVPLAIACFVAAGFFAGRCAAREQLCERRCQQDGAVSGSQSDENAFASADLHCNCSWPGESL